MKKKATNKYYRLVLILLVLVFSLIALVLAYNYFTFPTDKCLTNFDTLFSNYSQENHEKFVTDNFKTQYSSFEERTSEDDLRFDFEEIQFSGKAFGLKTKLFICPDQGDNIFAFGCNGPGYFFVLENGECKLDEIGWYFD